MAYCHWCPTGGHKWQRPDKINTMVPFQAIREIIYRDKYLEVECGSWFVLCLKFYWRLLSAVWNRRVSDSLKWRHNGRDSVSNHQHRECLLSRLSRRRSKKTSKFRVTDLCAGNSQGTGEFPTERASNAKNVSIWWCYHIFVLTVWFSRQFISELHLLHTVQMSSGYINISSK